jgi:hypothetical protein
LQINFYALVELKQINNPEDEEQYQLGNYDALQVCVHIRLRGFNVNSVNHGQYNSDKYFRKHCKNINHQGV